MKKMLLLFGILAVTAAAMACGDQAATPAAPSPAVSSDTNAAAADGSTLKVTAPAPQQPANGSTADSLAPNLVIANSTLKYLGDVALAASIRYKINVETPAGAPYSRNIQAPLFRCPRAARSWQISTHRKITPG